jgi:hypothetical protein
VAALLTGESRKIWKINKYGKTSLKFHLYLLNGLLFQETTHVLAKQDHSASGFLMVFPNASPFAQKTCAKLTAKTVTYRKLCIFSIFSSILSRCFDV